MSYFGTLVYIANEYKIYFCKYKTTSLLIHRNIEQNTIDKNEAKPARNLS